MENVHPDSDTIKRRLTDPATALHALDLLDGATRQARGFLVRCVWHQERTGSLSVTTGPGGTLRAFCFGCGRCGDVLALYAAAQGLDVVADFPRVLRELAARCGLDGGRALPPPPRPRPTKPLSRPLLAEVLALWNRCIPVCDNPALSLALFSRALDPAVIADRDLARSLPDAGPLPRFAYRDGKSWRESGHTLIVPLFNAHGEIASVRARSLSPDADPKGLSAAGHTSAGLVMADGFAREVFAHGIPSWWAGDEPPPFIVAEGEPDYLTDALVFAQWERAPATLGVINGSWSPAIAERVPSAARVIIRTHGDDAGKKYQRQIGESLHARCRVEVASHG